MIKDTLQDMKMHKVIECSGSATAYAVKAGNLFEQTFTACSKDFISEEYKKKRSSYHKREQHKANAIKKQMLDIHVS